MSPAAPCNPTHPHSTLTLTLHTHTPHSHSHSTLTPTLHTHTHTPHSHPHSTLTPTLHTHTPEKMVSPGRDFPGRGSCSSAKGPVSRILSCAVIPLGAASPRTLISDLPGGFGNCTRHPSDEDLSPETPPGTALPHRADA